MKSFLDICKLIYSPVSWIREFVKISKRSLEFRLIQMHTRDYLDFQTIAHFIQYSVVPYTKVVLFKYEKNINQISFKTDFQDPYQVVNLKFRNKFSVNTFPVPNPLETQGIFSNEKMKDISSLLQFMPKIDKSFILNLLLM